MSPEQLREIAIKIIGDIDYDMSKEAMASIGEEDEWEITINSIIDHLIDVFNEGYQYCRVDHGFED